MAFDFNPTDGFRNAAAFPNPTSETGVREQFQSLLDQLKNALNAVDLAKVNVDDINGIVAGQINTIDPVTGYGYAIIIENGLLGVRRVS